VPGNRAPIPGRSNFPVGLRGRGSTLDVSAIAAALNAEASGEGEQNFEPCVGKDCERKP
jgi:hypothetical protein